MFFIFNNVFLFMSSEIVRYKISVSTPYTNSEIRSFDIGIKYLVKYTRPTVIAKTIVDIRYLPRIANILSLNPIFFLYQMKIMPKETEDARTVPMIIP